MNKNFIITIFLCICFFILGILLEKIYLNKQPINKKQKDESLRSLSNERKFTNPLLDCEPNFTYINPNLEKILIQKVKEFSKNPSIELISVYFRDLSNGSWYGVNEREKFIPGSLNKVPLMIAAFKLSEEYPIVFTYKFAFNETNGKFRKLEITENPDTNEKLFNFYDVVEYMIKFSLNETAGFLIELLNSINRQFVDNVFLDLGINPPSNNKLHQVNTKDYASFFRVLYNATYINDKNSEMALLFLSETEFQNGLVKGIGENIIISHKYGQISENALFQLHDCGIIYYPGNNYLLCVMVKGYNFNQMEKVIQEVSKCVYQEVRKQAAQQ